MKKVFVVTKSAINGDAYVLAVFANEAEAEQAAKKHTDLTKGVKAWADEVNFYE